MKLINYACFKLEQKTTKSVKKNKSNFINIIGDKIIKYLCIIIMSIR